MLENWFAMGPNHKHVINIPPPNEGLLVQGLEEVAFQPPHKQVGVSVCHACPHGCAMLLKVIVTIEGE